MKCARCAVKTFNASWPRSSASRGHWPRCITYCIDSVTPTCDHGRDIAKRIRGGRGRICARVAREVGGQPLTRESYQAQLAALRDQLKAALSNQAADQNPNAATSAVELAKKVKSLRAAHATDAAPERTQHQERAATEPAVTRIRKSLVLRQILIFG
jgi:hypothetical protein